ncbi:helix-turn-helix domain-containing protein [Streptomyces wadayamensis]|uniref:XRE family transcriptional regulator n=1 Tax=Streptomyces wadayamensis TaxID=141454 RepID=A0ABR4SAZ5_9ACTN|nr:helix-turn-helix transcriptional regulator [Streptomyces wadayamensis]KDR62842.1 XRE family transcriptional regulator [Streptomyces wadayamensis]
MITDVESATPALCRLQLGRELRKLRAAAGLTSTQVVRKLICSPSKLTRLETGENAVVETADVMALCEIYGARPEVRELLIGYAAVTKTRKDWWQSPEYRPAISPTFKAYLGLEATAEALHNYEGEYVPGLLQTEGYVRAIQEMAPEALPADEIDRLVAVRMTRQEAMHRADRPLKFAAIINEAVLRRQVGGPAVMRAQVEHLAEMASHPAVRVQVVPFKAGVHAGMNGAFTLLRFEDASPIVYLENLGGASVMRRRADVVQYEEAFTDLQILAVGPQESLGMIKEAIKEF